MFQFIIDALNKLLLVMRKATSDLELEEIKTRKHVSDLQLQVESARKAIEEFVLVLNPPTERVLFRINIGGLEIWTNHMDMKADKKYKFSPVVTDSKGNVAGIENPQWSLTDPAKGTLVVSEDGMSAEFEATNNQLGDFKIQLSGDGIIGEGEKILSGELELKLLPGDAAVISLSGAEVVA